MTCRALIIVIVYQISSAHQLSTGQAPGHHVTRLLFWLSDSWQQLRRAENEPNRVPCGVPVHGRLRETQNESKQAFPSMMWPGSLTCHINLVWLLYRPSWFGWDHKSTPNTPRECLISDRLRKPIAVTVQSRGTPVSHRSHHPVWCDPPPFGRALWPPRLSHGCVAPSNNQNS